jgi:hypothetical protein
LAQGKGLPKMTPAGGGYKVTPNKGGSGPGVSQKARDYRPGISNHVVETQVTHQGITKKSGK